MTNITILEKGILLGSLLVAGSFTLFKVFKPKNAKT